MTQLPVLDSADIVEARGPKNPLNPQRPYAYYAELERAPNGRVEDVLTLLLTNHECPFRCVMCDLWKNTLDTPTPRGAIAEQIAWGCQQLPPANHIKLYNSGNFFDAKAVPTADLADIASLVAHLETVIVENHPAFCGSGCVDFSQRINGQLEVAIGLETVHEPTLQWLNKRMSLDDYQTACRFLREHSIALRSFVLLRPPGMSDEEGMEWALRSVEFAFESGVRCVAIVPVRAGNGVMDQLQQSGHFQPPTLATMERTLDRALGFADSGHRVFVDLWDVEHFAECNVCVAARKERLHQINLTQRPLAPVTCDVCGR